MTPRTIREQIGENKKFWEFFSLRGGGGSPIPKSICQNSDQKVNIFVKTKNDPKGLKCKINHIFVVVGKQGFPKGGGGSDIWEKFPKNPVFWGGWRP